MIMIRIFFRVTRQMICVSITISPHVETVCLLSQQKPDDTIEIDLDLDELDAASAEMKACDQMEKVMAYGVMSMPAVVMNETVASTGKVLKSTEVIKLLGKLGF